MRALPRDVARLYAELTLAVSGFCRKPVSPPFRNIVTKLPAADRDRRAKLSDAWWAARPHVPESRAPAPPVEFAVPPC
jgi:hypothetical protein